MTWGNPINAAVGQAPARRLNGPKSFKASRYCKLDQVSDEVNGFLALRAAAFASGGRVQVWFEPGKYNLGSIPLGRLFEVFSDLEIIAEGAEFIVGSVSTSGWDLTPTDAAIYDNGIFYRALPNIDNFRFYGGRFTLTPSQLAPILIGDSGTHTSGAPSNGGWIIEGLEQVGGCGPIVLRGSDVQIRETGLKLTASGWFCSANRNFKFRGNRGDHTGVDAGETTWTNTAFLVYNNCQDFDVSGNRSEAAGGTALLCRSTQEVVRVGTITKNRVIRAGLGAGSCRTFSGSAKRVESVTMADNICDGWMCSVDASTHGPHDAWSIGNTVSGGVVDSCTLHNNTANYDAEAESWNASTLVIDDSTNPVKNTLAQTMAGINVPGVAGSVAYNMTVAANRVRRAPSLAVAGAYMVGGIIAGNVSRESGYTRSSGVPLVSSHAFLLSDSAFVKAQGNTWIGQCPGSNGTDAKSIAQQFTNCLRCEDIDNTIIDNDTTTYTSAQINRATRLTGGSAWAAVSGINATSAELPSLLSRGLKVRGTYWGLYPIDGGHYALSSTGVLTVEQNDYVCVPTGSTTIDIGVTRVRKDATGAQTITLPDPSACTGTAVEVRNASSSGDITMAAAVGTITATTLTPGQYATFRARGTVWERIA